VQELYNFKIAKLKKTRLKFLNWNWYTVY